MRLLKQPNIWSCFPTALAMCVDRDVSEVLAAIGHDGSEIISSTEPEPYNRVSFHAAEISYAAWELGFTLTEFAKHRTMRRPDDSVHQIPDFQLEDFLKDKLGIITGYSPLGAPHAVAWCSEKQLIYDPGFKIYELSEFDAKKFYAVTKRLID